MVVISGDAVFSRERQIKLNLSPSPPFPSGLGNEIPVQRWKNFQLLPENFQYLKEEVKGELVRTCYECRALFSL